MNTGKLRIESGAPFSFKDWLEGENKKRVKEVLVELHAVQTASAEKGRMLTIISLVK